jgi:hypothetical protein
MADKAVNTYPLAFTQEVQSDLEHRRDGDQ